MGIKKSYPGYDGGYFGAVDFDFRQDAAPHSAAVFFIQGFIYGFKVGCEESFQSLSVRLFFFPCLFVGIRDFAFQVVGGGLIVCIVHIAGNVGHIQAAKLLL